MIGRLRNCRSRLRSAWRRKWAFWARRINWVLSTWKEDDANIFFSQFGEDAFLQGYFRGKAWEKYKNPDRIDAGFYIDVGAHAPRTHSNTYWFYRRGWRGINIDPTPGTTATFLRERPRDTTLEVAISNKPGELTFYSFGTPHLVNTLDPKHASDWAKVLGMEPVQLGVKALLLKDVIAQHVPAGQHIDFCSIDAEGHDLQVLQSNDWALYRPELLLIECHCTSWQELQESASNQLLSSVGYSLRAWLPPSVVYKRSAPEWVP